MKKLALVIALFINLAVFAQYQVEYIYDNAGNRIQRKVYQLPNGLVAQNNEPQEKTENLQALTEAETAEFESDVQGEHQFRLFPNPVTTEVQIEMSESFMKLQNKQLILVDMKGNQIERRNVNDTVEKLNFSNLPKGSYIVRVSSGVVSQEWRVVKE